MPFSQATIVSVNPPRAEGGQVWVSWVSSSPDGTWFQIYEDGLLAWHGQERGTWLPIPPSTVRVDIGTVAAGEELTDFGSSLPAAPARRVRLTWFGGTFEADDIAGFHVYGSRSPGGAIDYVTPLETITAYPSGVILDGFGRGGFGRGGFGRAASSYSWTSDSLETGLWSFGVRPFDEAGNEGNKREVTVAIAGPPTAPVPYADRSRLAYTYSNVTHKATLSWNASPTT